jgi:hypothetical protein
VVRGLIAAGADLDLPDRTTSMTALHYAATNGYMEILEMLIGVFKLSCLFIFLSVALDALGCCSLSLPWLQLAVRLAVILPSVLCC